MQIRPMGKLVTIHLSSSLFPLPSFSFPFLPFFIAFHCLLFSSLLSPSFSFPVLFCSFPPSLPFLLLPYFLLPLPFAQYTLHPVLSPLPFLSVSYTRFSFSLSLCSFFSLSFPLSFLLSLSLFIFPLISFLFSFLLFPFPFFSLPFPLLYFTPFLFFLSPSKIPPNFPRYWATLPPRPPLVYATHYFF